MKNSNDKEIPELTTGKKIAMTFGLSVMALFLYFVLFAGPEQVEREKAIRDSLEQVHNRLDDYDDSIRYVYDKLRFKAVINSANDVKALLVAPDQSDVPSYYDDHLFNVSMGADTMMKVSFVVGAMNRLGVKSNVRFNMNYLIVGDPYSDSEDSYDLLFYDHSVKH